jgi:hypothetical protein
VLQLRNGVAVSIQIGLRDLVPGELLGVSRLVVSSVVLEEVIELVVDKDRRLHGLRDIDVDTADDGEPGAGVGHFAGLRAVVVLGSAVAVVSLDLLDDIRIHRANPEAEHQEHNT